MIQLFAVISQTFTVFYNAELCRTVTVWLGLHTKNKQKNNYFVQENIVVLWSASSVTSIPI